MPHRNSGTLRLLPRLALLLILALASFPLTAQSPQPATSIQQIRAFTPEQAAAHPVLLRGVVTVLSGWKNSFFLQDATSGISVDRLDEAPALQPGDEIEVRGITGPGLFAPIVIAQHVTVLGTGKVLPAAPLRTPTELAEGREDSQWLSVRGIVRSAQIKPSWGRSVLFLKIDLGDHSLITARVYTFSQQDLARLPAARVLIRGVCGTIFNGKRQFLGLRLFVDNLSDVVIEHSAPQQTFDAPLRPLDALLHFNDHTGAVAQVKVHGTVTYARLGVGLYIQDGVNGLYIESAQTTPVPDGYQVEAVGYPAVGRYSPKLEDAVFRIVGNGPAIGPLHRSASEMIVTNDGFANAPLDSSLVQVQGKLIEQIPRTEEDLLLLQDGPVIFTARLPRAKANQAPPVVGSVLSVTGVCAANTDDAHEVRNFEILLRSSADVTVLKRAPWWTPTHAEWTVCVLAVLVLLNYAWLAIVRRQDKLRALAVTDALTGLYNRRGFLLLAQQQWQLAQRRNTPLMLFYMDLDRFKEINDTRGHKAGDLALQTVADILRGIFRKADIIGRLGGDEFAVAAVEANEQSRPVLEERIATAIKHANEKHPNAPALALSVGVISCDSTLGAMPIEEILTRADALMYEQKRARKAAL